MLHCKKCLVGRTGDAVGKACQTSGCDGVIEEAPKWADLVVRGEPQVCGRRGEHVLAMAPPPDYWEKFKSVDNRVCSYCGSLHPDDMFRLVKESAEAPEDAPYRETVSVEPSDKSYKIYVHQLGVRNAHEGGIKFYTQHLPRKPDGSLDVTDEQQAQYAKAVRRTRARFERYLAERGMTGGMNMPGGGG